MRAYIAKGISATNLSPLTCQAMSDASNPEILGGLVVTSAVEVGSSDVEDSPRCAAMYLSLLFSILARVAPEMYEGIGR